MKESSVPALSEVAPGVLQWSFYTDTPYRVRLIAFLCIAGLGWLLVVCATILALLQPDNSWPEVAMQIWPFALAALLWSGCWAFICYCSVVHEVDSHNREMRRTVYLFGRRLYTRTKRVRSGDKIVLSSIRDLEHGGRQYQAYLRRGGFNSLIGYYHLKCETDCAQLKAMYDQIARALRIENAGYQPGPFSWSWLTQFKLFD